MMILKDGTADGRRFPLSLLLDRISDCFCLRLDSTVRVVRFGGVGQKVWAIESALDEGHNVAVSLAQLKSIADDPNEICDEMYCIHDAVTFGLSDASFLFVQSQDKIAEANVAKSFADVAEMPDRDFE